MKFEPVLDKASLLEVIRREYDLPVTSLIHLPEGEVGCHYIAAGEAGGKYFATLLLGNRLAQLQAERLNFTLALTCQLFDQGLFQALVPPLRTVSGRLHTEFEGQPLFLSDFIPGTSLAAQQPYTAEILVGLGRLTARLHALMDRLEMEIPDAEDFTIPFEPTFRSSLAELDRVDATSRRGRRTLRDLLLPRREELFSLMDRLNELGAAARELHPPMVLAHTDLTPANLLLTPFGELFIVDWGGARLAPAEQDLALLTGEGFPLLLAEYLKEARRPVLHPELFAFYFHRRILEDLTDFLVQILSENRSDDQDARDLHWLQLDCLDGLAGLAEGEAWAARQLVSVS